MTPPRSEKRRNGASPRNASRPSRNVDPVIVRISQFCATSCIHVPTLDVKAPAHIRRKSRYPNALSALRKPRVAYAGSVSAPVWRAASAEPAGLEVLERLDDLGARVHHEGSRARDGLVERLSGDEQRAQPGSRGGLEARGLAVVAKEDELVRTRRRALGAEEALALDDVNERIEVFAERLLEHRAGLELHVEIRDGRAGVDHGPRAERLAREDAGRPPCRR